jgi:hypothetical protein
MNEYTSSFFKDPEGMSHTGPRPRMEGDIKMNLKSSMRNLTRLIL